MGSQKIDFSAMLASSVIKIGEKELTCREISAKKRELFLDFQQENSETTKWAAYLAILGCDEFEGFSVDDLMDIASDQAILKIATEVGELSGIIAKKNSPGAKKSDSATD